MSNDKLTIMLLGGNAVGKSCFLQRCEKEKLTEWPDVTIGVAFGKKIVKVNNKNLLIHIWDTAGNERYYSLIKSYYKSTNAKVAIVCYDLSRPETFDEAKFWVKDFKNSVENCRIYLCGLKKDELNIFKKPFCFAEVDKYAEEQQIKSFLMSSKTGENFEELFETIIQDHINSSKS